MIMPVHHYTTLGVIRYPPVLFESVFVQYVMAVGVIHRLRTSSAAMRSTFMAAGHELVQC